MIRTVGTMGIPRIDGGTEVVFEGLRKETALDLCLKSKVEGFKGQS